MHPFWKSNFGKLTAGACGTQVGAVFTCGALTSVLFVCAICGFGNVLSFGLTQSVAPPAPTPMLAQVSTSNEELELLRVKLNLLNKRVAGLKENPPVAVVAPIATPAPPPKAIAVAYQNPANLRSGPGTDYTRIGRMDLGDTFEIVGRNTEGGWWLVATSGGFAWVADDAVITFNVDETIPIVSIPALLAYAGGQGGPAPALPPTNMLPETGNTSTLPQPAGTPTAEAYASRHYAQDTRGYKQLARHLLLPTSSESFSPHGDQIAITEKIKLYLTTPDGANSQVLLENDQTITLIGNTIWSPNGQSLAFVAEKIDAANSNNKHRVVGIMSISNGTVTYLESEPQLNVDLPRWTQDSRLLVNIHPGDPIYGTVYVYNTAGQGEVADGVYLLSSSHSGQKWSPWQPGKSWQVDLAQPTGYYD